MKSQAIESFHQLIFKLPEVTLPEGVSVVERENCVIFMFIEENGKTIDIRFKLTVWRDRTFIMTVHRTCLPKSKVAHITNLDTIQYVWDISNILAFLKTFMEEHSRHESTLKLIVDDFKQKVSNITIEDNVTTKKVGFLLEQLTLVTVSKHQRKYSSDLLVCASIWKNTSTTLYKRILKDNVLTLPQISWLQKLSSCLSTEFGLSSANKEYLRRRIAVLRNSEKIVLLAVDEIYVKKQVEFFNGKICGLKDGEEVKTVLCFMISSIAGRYQDMVAQYPMTNLNAATMEQCTMRVIDTLSEIGFQVLILCTDNASTNRKFVTSLGSGMMQPHVTHPYIPEKKLFLLFDPVHNFKNVYNNFQSRAKFSCPDFENFGSMWCPSFKHVVDLFEIEKAKPIKMAYKLSQKMLSPKSIEKTNVQLAAGLFHESTINALEFYVENHEKPWMDTVKFLKLILQWWKIVNTKVPYFHVKTRDPTRAPIRSENDENMLFLAKFELWLKEWESHLKTQGRERQGLTVPTMQAMTLSTQSLQSIALFLLAEEGFEYVLLGKCQSDKIEGHFGWYRQMSGGNYFISSRQILESEKLIKIQSLVKFSGYNFNDIKSMFQAINDQDQVQIGLDAIYLEELVNFIPSEELATEDSSILYYVGGYLARSMHKRVNCESCKDLIRDGKATLLPAFEENGMAMTEEKERFVKQVTRGGLSKPTDLVFMVCVHIRSFFESIMKNVESKTFLLDCQHPRDVFSTGYVSALSSDVDTENITLVKCNNGHGFEPFCTELAKRLFNVFFKNFAGSKNSEIHLKRSHQSSGSKSSARGRKVAKLQSEN